jgi:segregation and condensation protein B
MLYGTTQDFLRHFGLSHLSELPVIENANETIKPPEEKGQELPFEGDLPQQSSSEITEETPAIEEFENETEVIAESEPSAPENQNT